MVRVKKVQMCHSCPSSGFCQKGSTDERQVLARNPVGAKEGQRVEIEVKDGLFLKASFIIYMLPLFALLGGALLGRWIIRAFNIPMSEDAGAVICGLGCTIAMFILIRIRSTSSYFMKKYQPTIIKTKQEGEV